MMKKRIKFLVASMIITGALTACTGKNNDPAASSAPTEAAPETTESSATAATESTSATEKPTEEAEAPKEAAGYLSHMDELITVMDEDGNKLAEYDIEKIKEECSNSSCDLSNAYFKAAGDGKIIYSDYSYSDDGDSKYEFYVVDPESKEVEPILTTESGFYVERCDFYNGKFYMNGNKDGMHLERVFSWNEGSLVPVEEDFAYPDVAKELNTETPMFLSADMNNGFYNTYECSYTRALDDNGYIIIMDGEEYYKLYTDGTKEKIEGLPDMSFYIQSYNKDGLIYQLYDENVTGSSYHFLDYEDGSDMVFVKADKEPSFLTYADGKFYYDVFEADKFYMGDHHVYCFDCAGKKSTEVYTTSKEPGVYIDPGITGMRLIGDDIYFLGVDDESTQWIRYADGTFTPTGIEKKEIGALKYGYIRYENGMQKCSNCGIPRVKYYQEVFQLDSEYSPHASEINSALMQEFRQSVDFYGKEDIDPEDPSECEEHKANSYMWCESDEWNITDVHKIGENILVIDMSGYWYGGGAHGMPLRSQRCFNLQTGKEIKFKDFYKGDEETFKTLVAEKTAEDFDSYEEYEAPYFAETRVDVYDQAYEYAGIETSNIELTEDGICLYYMPYEMGPYAAGFIEINISYDELGYRPE